MYTYRKKWYPYVSPFDPCPPMRVKTYETPPQLYLGFQPYNLPQFPPRKALRYGTLWPMLYAPYENPYEDAYDSSGIRKAPERDREDDQ